MINPITQNIRYLTSYFIIWLVLAGIQICILYFLFHVDLVPSIYDGFVFTILLSGVGLAIWPLVNFSSLDRVYLTNTLITHIAGAVMLVAAWIGISWTILHYLLNSNTNYLLFLQSSLLWRGSLGAIFYLLVALNYYVFVYNEEFKLRAVNESELKRSLKEAELSMLKSQLNPHFIFNSLNSISSLTITNPEKAQEMVIALSEFIRYSIKPDQNKLISLKSELDAINQFLIIEKVRFGDRLQLKIICDSMCNTSQLPPLIIQPLVENAIKYGVHETMDQGIITISCNCKKDILVIIVTNNYDVANNSILKTGVGLQNIRSRLKLLYDSDELLQIMNDGNTFTAKLLIPQKI